MNPKRSRNKAMRYITRVDYRRTPPGWLVRLYTVNDGYAVKEYFWDSRHGGREKSLAAAIDYRNWVEENWPKPPNYKGWCGYQYGFLQSTRKDNKSGRTGVFETKYSYLKKGRANNGKTYYYPTHCHYWNAAWVENGKNMVKYFCVKKYGYQKAYELAVAHRIDMEKKLMNINTIRPCSCMTKTPDFEFHKKNCAYRIDMEKWIYETRNDRN